MENESLPGELRLNEGLGAGPEAPCTCHACVRAADIRWNGLRLDFAMLIVCPDCGNKRCPHATDHLLACTNSNDPSQVGSVYGGVCRYPDCNCPFDAPADQNWCARGLPSLRAPNVRVKAAGTPVGP